MHDISASSYSFSNGIQTQERVQCAHSVVPFIKKEKVASIVVLYVQQHLSAGQDVCFKAAAVVEGS